MEGLAMDEKRLFESGGRGDEETAENEEICWLRHRARQGHALSARDDASARQSSWKCGSMTILCEESALHDRRRGAVEARRDGDDFAGESESCHCRL